MLIQPSSGDIDIVRELVKRGANPVERQQTCDFSELQQLKYAVALDLYTDEKTAEIVDILISAGADINEYLTLPVFDNIKFDLLFQSIATNYTKLSIAVITAGFDMKKEHAGPSSSGRGYLSSALEESNLPSMVLIFGRIDREQEGAYSI